MQHPTLASVFLAATLLAVPGLAQAQSQNPPAAAARTARPAYGSPLALEQARRVVAAGQARARELKVPDGVAIAVLDSRCHASLIEVQDGSSAGVAPVAQDKAYTACAFRVDTQASQKFLAGGGSGAIMLKLRDFTPIEGGKMIVSGGKLVGAVGVSGGTSAEDAEIANAAAAALN